MPGGTIALTHVPSPRMDACVRTFAAVETIDLGRVAEQHAAYRTALERAGATVEVLDDNREHPDAVFIEDAAIVLDEVAIPAGSARHRRVVAILPPVTREPLAANVVAIGDAVVAGAYPRTAERIAPHARDVIVVDLGELAKADGSATCLSILIAGR